MERREYVESKHKQLNEFAKEMRLNVNEALKKQVDVYSKEIEKQENRLKYARFIFIIIFAGGILTSIVLTIITNAIVTGLGIAGGSFSAEIALYTTITGAMERKISEVSNHRSRIIDSWIDDKKNIGRTLGAESKSLTSLLTDEEALNEKTKKY